MNGPPQRTPGGVRARRRRGERPLETGGMRWTGGWNWKWTGGRGVARREGRQGFDKRVNRGGGSIIVLIEFGHFSNSSNPAIGTAAAAPGGRGRFSHRFC